VAAAKSSSQYILCAIVFCVSLAFLSGDVSLTTPTFGIRAREAIQEAEFMASAFGRIEGSGEHRRRSRSPTVPRGRRGREVMIERVVERTAAPAMYPVLTKQNYAKWSLVMQVNLQA
jgi:hypothetical protein